jgi:hypothetical protein
MDSDPQPGSAGTWEYHMHRCSLLDAHQKAAIARFLAERSKLVELDAEGTHMGGNGANQDLSAFFPRL